MRKSSRNDVFHTAATTVEQTSLMVCIGNNWVDVVFLSENYIFITFSIKYFIFFTICLLDDRRQPCWSTIWRHFSRGNSHHYISLRLLLILSVKLLDRKHTITGCQAIVIYWKRHALKHTYTRIYIYVWAFVSACMCICARAYLCVCVTGFFQLQCSKTSNQTLVHSRI